MPHSLGTHTQARLRSDPRRLLRHRMGSAKKTRQSRRHARGYTNAHVAHRRQLEPLVATGQVNCSRCGEPIHPGHPWHLDHADDRRSYLGPAHAACNLRAAAEKTNASRRDHPLIWSRIWYEPIPPNVIVMGDVDADKGRLFMSARPRYRRFARA